MTRILLKKIIKTAFNPRSFWIRTSTAYFLLMALIPTFGVLSLFMDIFNIPMSILIPYLSYVFPTDASKIIEEYLLNTHLNLDIIPLIFTLVFSFNILSGGIDTLSMLADEMFNFKSKPFLKRKIKSIILSLVLILGLIIMLVLSMLFPTIFNIEMLFAIMFPIMWLSLFLVILLIFMYTPSERLKFKDVIYGTIFSSLMIAALLQFFGVYIKYFGRFDSFYGPLASIIILLIMFDWMAQLLYFGISINVVVYNQYKRDKTS